MRRVHVGVGSVNQLVLDWSGNTARLIELVKKSAASRVDILCLPELAVTGYGAEDLFLAPFFLQRAWSELTVLAAQVEDILVCVGVPIFHHGRVYNCAAYLNQGSVCALVAKQFLANEGVHYEARWFSPWSAGAVSVHQRVPLGDLVLEWGGVRIGTEICEDGWVASRPARSFPSRGVDIVCHPNASHFAFGKHEVRCRYITDISRAAGVAVLATNLHGNESGRIIFDGDGTIAAGGEILAERDRLYLGESALTTCFVDCDSLARQRTRSSTGRAQDFDDAVVLVNGGPGGQGEVFNSHPVRAWSSSSFIEEEECARAVTLGLSDYLRKSKSRGCVVSLSGGADSAITAVFAALALRRIYSELPQHKRPVWETELEPTLAEALAARIGAAYQRTSQSSVTTKQAATSLARTLGVTFSVWEIDTLVAGFESMVTKSTGGELTWEGDDLARQNIQSRVRSPGIWLLANLRRSLLLTTGNRSEAAVGYATMDGDTSGGLNLIGGLSKPFVRRWLLWLAEHGYEGWTVPELRDIATQAPTAELRPLAVGQTDEGDLMPYPILLAIERCAVFEGKSPLEAYSSLRSEFPDLNDTERKGYVAKVYRLWARAQWKRERLAPSFHLDDYNLDPRSWCRFPILSGGYEDEIAKMCADV